MKDKECFTKSADSALVQLRSYLDYFITKNVYNAELEVLDTIGNSDHKTLRLKITQTEMTPNMGRNYNH